MEKFSFALSSEMPPDQMDRVRGKLNELHDLYMTVGGFRSDAEEAAFLDRIEELDRLAQRVTEAKSREEQGRLYGELYEGIKVLDADIQARRLLAPRGEPTPTP